MNNTVAEMEWWNWFWTLTAI